MQQLVHRVDFALGFDLLDLPGDLAVVDRGVLDGPDYSQGDGVVAASIEWSVVSRWWASCVSTSSSV